ncbi:glycosyl transferase family 2 [Microbacterium sp. SLBN-154]|uniref:glycosyltransferase n=1 Tax=Microbacterium sp. SLBN-154 TaxID=2768458 RepID=UPI0011507E74|nr:glycosyltransferase [Microbacterium sp. SLBN-154]TQK18635.1 glycosyl transferase family 2 [Microbacterium sp. SLBN-154]
MSTTEHETPVILVGFRRGNELRQTLEATISHHSGPIYVFLDHPRDNVASDVAACEEVGTMVSEYAAEHARVVVRRPPQNLGVARAMPAAIDWALADGFDRFILLEEDCLPSPDFFRFMVENLERYKDDPRVAMVSGNQFLPPEMARKLPYSYYFSRFIHIWGWGAWARSWASYDHQMTALRDEVVRSNLRSLFPRKREMVFYRRVWNRQLSDAKDTAWASRWLLAMLLARGLCICPRENLVENVGFGQESTHTRRQSRYHRTRHQAMGFPLVHPPQVIEWRIADKWWFDHLISKHPLSRVRRYAPTLSRSK